MALQVILPFRMMGQYVPDTLDHLILGCRDLESGIEFMEEKSGYRAAPGGSHPGRGTRNAFLGLGNRHYLEILAPDPDQSDLTWHKEIAKLTEPMLIGSALRTKNIAASAERLRARGIECIGPISCSQTCPDGEVLHWKSVEPVDDKSGFRPSFMEWDEHSRHPSSDAPGACLLTDLHLTGHLIDPLPPRVGFNKMLRPDHPAQLHAIIAGLTGEFELASQAVPSEAWTTR